jgi:hypothetical protein
MNEQINEGDNVMHPRKRGIGTVRYITGKYAMVLFGKTSMTYLLTDLTKVTLKTEEELRREYAQKKA